MIPPLFFLSKLLFSSRGYNFELKCRYDVLKSECSAEVAKFYAELDITLNRNTLPKDCKIGEPIGVNGMGTACSACHFINFGKLYHFKGDISKKTNKVKKLIYFKMFSEEIKYMIEIPEMGMITYKCNNILYI